MAAADWNAQVQQFQRYLQWQKYQEILTRAKMAHNYNFRRYCLRRQIKNDKPFVG